MGFFNYPGTTTRGDIRQTDAVLLEEISPEDWAKILKVVEVRPFSAGTDLVSHGDQDDALFVLVSGSVDVLVPDERGQLEQIAIISEGSVFGELAFFDRKSRSATIRARENGSALCIDRQAFNTLAAREPGLALQLLDDLGRSLAYKLRWEMERSQRG